MSNRYCLALVVFILTGCARTLPSSGPVDERPAMPRSPDEAREGRLTTVSSVVLTPDTSSRSYLTSSITRVQLITDTASNDASIKTTLVFSLAYSRRSSPRTHISGTLARMSVTSEGSVSASDQVLNLPLTFSGYIERGSLTLDSLSGAPVSIVPDCGSAAINAFGNIQRNLILPPLLLSSGTTWTDSSTVPVCSGSIPLTLTAIRTYRVAGQAIRGVAHVIVIDRDDRVRASGQGAQGQHRISIRSEGMGSARIYIDRVTGALRESKGTQTSDLVVGSSGRSQRFKQVVEENTALQ